MDARVVRAGIAAGIAGGAVIAVTAWRLRRARHAAPADPPQSAGQPAPGAPSTSQPADREPATRGPAGRDPAREP